jgi:hypothetical protein
MPHPLKSIAQSGLEARSRARVSSKVNGTTACTSHVCGKTGARQLIEGSTQYGAYSLVYSWVACGWTRNSGLSLTVASCAIAAEAKNVDPATRANCRDFRTVFLRRSCSHTVASSCAGLPTLRETSSGLRGFHLSTRGTRASIQRADAGMRVLMAPVQNAALFDVLLCLPTAPALPIEGNGDFGTSSIYGQLPDKLLLVSLLTWRAGRKAQ